MRPPSPTPDEVPERPRNGPPPAVAVAATGRPFAPPRVGAAEPAPAGPAVPPGVADLLAAYALAPNTRRAYAADWRAFTAWGAGAGLTTLPATPTTLARYLQEADATGGVPPGTLTRRCAAIRLAHLTAGHPTPTAHELVRQTLRALRRKRGVAPRRQAAPLVTALLRQVLAAIPEDDLRGVRDRALLLVGFAGALRRSELCAVDVDHLEAADDGYWLRIPSAKSDPEGKGERVTLPRGQHQATDPVIALERWVHLAAITRGPLFRGIDRWGHLAATRLDPGTVARILKGAVAAAGLAPARYSGHSLRAGLITAAVDAQVDDRTIQRQSRHRSRSGMEPYVRSRPSIRTSAAARVGL
ncbi:MAG TPA: tyrosine-type recombinase/integrase [Candidatus Dormibacteraeota bacterium]|nr:tyrosine-type recombinase/integrase [Candidatus Dormibacteraeota bacterium]